MTTSTPWLRQRNHYNLHGQDGGLLDRHNFIPNTTDNFPSPLARLTLDVTAERMMPNTAAKLEIRRSGALAQEFLLSSAIATLGRAPDNTVALSDDLSVSRHHAQISWNGSQCILTDLGSAAGTFVNEAKLLPHQPHTLVDGARIQIGAYELRFRMAQGAQSPPQGPVSAQKTTVFSPATPLSEPATGTQQLDLRGQDTLGIGRDLSNDMVINHPAASRFHAQIKKIQGSYIIFDLNSTNGTFVNGSPVVGQRALRVGDTIRIGPTNLTFNMNETLLRINEEGNLNLDAIHLKKQIKKDLNLLNDISLSIKAREFVAIAGVSGGGKSTLLDALNGFRPATSGAVLVNGVDLYKNFNAYRTEIGYVPQRDIVHMELTAEQALDFAAQLRMPADTTRAERKARVHEVLAELNLTHRRNVPVQALSGGQIKRVSIGVELLTKPSLFYLDEATSGLDPGTETGLMQLLRELADQGRTILLVTHATENVTLCDQVIFMARMGNLSYFGPPQEAPQFFGVERFNQIYTKVEEELTPEQWQHNYLRSAQCQKYITQRQQELTAPDARSGAQRQRQLPGAQVKTISAWRQFQILSKRNLAILARDRFTLALMLAVAPLLGLMDLIIWQKPLFNVDDGDPSLAVTMLFTTVLFAVLVGSMPTMREIVKEQEIYKRERIIGLQILPYVLSKVWLGLLLSFYQGAVILFFKVIAVPDLSSDPEILVGMYLTITLAFISGMMLGLFGSAIAPNQSVAPLLVIVFLVPQIIFGGGVLPLDTFGPSGRVINKFALTKWPFEAMVTLSGLGTDVAKDPCWQEITEYNNNDPETKKEPGDISDDAKLKCDCMGETVFKACAFPGVQRAYKPVVDEPAPVQPTSPDPQDYASQLEYQEALQQFQDDSKQYQEDYTDWNLRRKGSINKAEGTINGINSKFSHTFNVDVTQHLIVFGGFIGGFFVLILLVMKLKDLF